MTGKPDDTRGTLSAGLLAGLAVAALVAGELAWLALQGWGEGAHHAGSAAASAMWLLISAGLAVPLA